MKEMKNIRLFCLSVLMVLFVSCKTDNTILPEVEKPEVENPEVTEKEAYNELLIGDWHFYSGDFIEFLGKNSGSLYDQILTFTKAKNFSEKNIADSSNRTSYGNWAPKGEKIELNDFDGNKVDSLVNIDKLSANEMTISYQRYRATYRRVGHEDYKSAIIGKWNKSGYSKEQEYFLFEKNGNATETDYLISFLNPTYYKWEINGDQLVLTKSNSTNKSKEYKIQYCNKYYLKWEGGDVLKSAGAY